MAKTRYAETRVNTWFGVKIVSGYIPSGLEYFQSTYQGRPVEYSVYRDERPETVDITYLDVGEAEAVEVGVVLLSELEKDFEPADWFDVPVDFDEEGEDE